MIENQFSEWMKTFLQLITEDSNYTSETSASLAFKQTYELDGHTSIEASRSIKPNKNSQNFRGSLGFLRLVWWSSPTARMADQTETYYADFLKKEDHTGKWRLYWASLNVSGLYFRLGRTVEGHNNFQQCIELTPESRCVIAKRRMYSFRFNLITKGEVYTLKCGSVLQRYRWMYMIDLVVNGRPPESPPNSIVPLLNDEATRNHKNSVDGEDSSNQRNSKPRNVIAKSSSFIRVLSFKKMGNRKKRNNSLPAARSTRKKENMSNTNSTKMSDIDCSFNFAENMAFSGD